jgi:hypothetical protein
MYIIKRIIGVSFAIVILASCNSKKDSTAGGARRPQGPLVVDGFIVQPSAISENIEVPGSLLPFEETQIRAEVIPFALTLGIVIGGVVSLLLLVTRLVKRGDYLPYGQYLAAGGIIMLIWGVQVVDWYLAPYR